MQKKSDELLIIYKQDASLMALKISQRKLSRVQQLEEAAAAAREELLEELEAGFQAETGELTIDSAIVRSGATAAKPIVVKRPARAREGKATRVFVISTRERILVRDWNSSQDIGDVELIARKLIRRAAVILSRECDLFRANANWTHFATLFGRECLFRSSVFRLRILFALHRSGLIKADNSIRSICFTMIDSFRITA
ncbi:MAG: hypothetical protein EPO02_12905 [Nitrospirae bacterium]|nr:MAG: hypothetical protein EPO02_12905 [Nitrospirota bacterium]